LHDGKRKDLMRPYLQRFGELSDWKEIEVKLSLCLIKHGMKTYGEAEV
jgi:hypothetical protein